MLEVLSGGTLRQLPGSCRTRTRVLPKRRRGRPFLLKEVILYREFRAAATEETVRSPHSGTSKLKPVTVEELAKLVNPAIIDPGMFIESVRAREAAVSTATADHVAFPHARTEAVSRLLLVIGRSETGVSFHRDRRVVHLVFLIGAPPHAAKRAGLIGNNRSAADSFLWRKLRNLSRICCP
jgi:hypothetical protein